MSDLNESTTFNNAFRQVETQQKRSIESLAAAWNKSRQDPACVVSIFNFQWARLTFLLGLDGRFRSDCKFVPSPNPRPGPVWRACGVFAV